MPPTDDPTPSPSYADPGTPGRVWRYVDASGGVQVLVEEILQDGRVRLRQQGRRGQVASEWSATYVDATDVDGAVRATIDAWAEAGYTHDEEPMDSAEDPPA